MTHIIRASIDQCFHGLKSLKHGATPKGYFEKIIKILGGSYRPTIGEARSQAFDFIIESMKTAKPMVT